MGFAEVRDKGIGHRYRQGKGGKSPGWFDVSQKNSAQDVMYEWSVTLS